MCIGRHCRVTTYVPCVFHRTTLHCPITQSLREPSRPNFRKVITSASVPQGFHRSPLAWGRCRAVVSFRARLLYTTFLPKVNTRRDTQQTQPLFSAPCGLYGVFAMLPSPHSCKILSLPPLGNTHEKKYSAIKKHPAHRQGTVPCKNFSPVPSPAVPAQPHRASFPRCSTLPPREPPCPACRSRF